MSTKTVQLSTDHLERQSKCRPELALEELIWNGLDAGGAGVEVSLERNAIEGVAAIEIRDFGTGIPFANIERAFGFIGRSLKLEQKSTEEGRALHGSEGRGRFRALVLGTHATWTTTFKSGGDYSTYTITIDRDSQVKYEVTDPVPSASRSTGTIVRVEGIYSGQDSLTSEATKQRLTQRLALYLYRYPAFVSLDGKALDVRSCIKHITPYPLTEYDSTLEVVEWSFETRAKELLLCDTEGFAWHEMSAGIQARGLSFTAFLRCPKAREWRESGIFVTGEPSPEVESLIKAAKDQLRGYVRSRLAREASGLVTEWKREKIYPYSEVAADASPVEVAERQVFDIVAAQVHLHHDAFRNSAREIRHLTLQLVRQAIESNPGSLKRILAEVIHLPPDQQDELAKLFDYASLGGIIAAANAVTTRLHAIAGFEGLIFSEDWRARLRERTQLHRLLVRHVWLFGEEYAMDTDDEGMKKVLEKHKALMGRDALAPDEIGEVKLIDGKGGIPDIMMSRQFERDGGRAEHLVLEFKRPKHDISDEDMTQIEKYAFTVAEDERFSKDNVKWTFILIGNEFSTYAKRRLMSHDVRDGQIFKGDNLTISLRKWSDIFHEAKTRYSFFRKKLELEVNAADGLVYLEERHGELLEGKGLTKKQEREYLTKKDAPSANDQQ